MSKRSSQLKLEEDEQVKKKSKEKTPSESTETEIVLESSDSDSDSSVVIESEYEVEDNQTVIISSSSSSSSSSSASSSSSTASSPAGSLYSPSGSSSRSASEKSLLSAKEGKYKPQCSPSGSSKLTQQLFTKVSLKAQEKSNNIACPRCQETFDDSYALSKHTCTRTDLNVTLFACRQCKVKFADLSKLEKHEKNHMRDELKPYQCIHCKKGFDERDSCRAHESKHENLTPHICRICENERFFSSAANRDRHERTHIRNQLLPFQCSHCDKGFHTKDSCMVHERKHHLSLSAYPCRFCSPPKFFAQSGTRDHHEKAHIRNQGKQYHCQTCKKGFDDQGSLEIHKRKHVGLNPYKCRICVPDRFFGTSSSRGKHEETHKRAELKQFKCIHCTRRFDDKESCSNHERLHLGLNPYACRFPECSPQKFFASTANRDRHEATHQRDRLQPFRCAQCNKGFEDKDLCHVHERKHLGMNPYPCRFPDCFPEKYFGNTGNRDRHEATHQQELQKPYSCGHCKKGFEDKELCHSHERKHLGLNPYKCRLCDPAKYFSTTHARDYHEATHIRNQQKPFHCNHCDKGFDDLSACKIHERKHFGLNPYKCQFCDQYFGQSGTRDAHEQTHKRKK